MWSYILKRLLLMVPTLFGILLLTFIVIQFVPGGPVEEMVAHIGNIVGPIGLLVANAAYMSMGSFFE